MKMIVTIVCLGLLVASTNALAEQIPEGTWRQTSSTAGDCPNCTIKIKKVAPHIIEIGSNNGWIGYAYYIQGKDIYKGASEWKSGQGGAYENTIFINELIYEGRTLTMKGHSNKLDAVSTYRKQ